MIDFSLSGKQLAILGPNGTGKSAIARQMAFDNGGRYVAFRDSYGHKADQDYFLQQRWNMSAMDADTPETVTFSSGELRKHHIREALEAGSRLLVLDNPYIGLDAPARNILTAQLTKMAGEGCTVVLVLSRTDELPAFVSHVLETFRGSSETKLQTIEEFRASHFPPEVIRLRNVSVSYGGKMILKPQNWIVHEGEHWAITGANGSGKSTLLSLICADNPQGYGCDITLFGKPRGTGETIWDIKKNIGYVSPEMHRAYDKVAATALEIVTSGLFDTVGLCRRPTPEQFETARGWMARFGIEELAGTLFPRLSSGQQRLCLVARAFVKNPPLYILDEPFHGLDNEWRQKVKGLINELCSAPGKTLLMVTHYPEEYPACIDHSLTL